MPTRLPTGSTGYVALLPQVPVSGLIPGPMPKPPKERDRHGQVPVLVEDSLSPATGGLKRRLHSSEGGRTFEARVVADMKDRVAGG
jgi:hypothetical protein